VRTLTLLAALALLTAGCDTDLLNETHTSLASRKVKVVATTTIVADLVRHVGGERVEVQTLMKSRVNPHRYRATPADVAAFGEADAVFYNGLGLEANLQHGLENLETRAVPYAVSDGIGSERLIRRGGVVDPHVWSDVGLWRRAARQVRDDLSSLDRANGSIYHDNAAAYDEELAELDRWIRARVARVPAGERVLATRHPAFAYFGRAYGFRTRTARSAPDELLTDSLGERGTSEDSYVGMMRSNVEAIVSSR
jgi:manganese/zinc/iron transport system substrate-binding protein